MKTSIEIREPIKSVTIYGYAECHSEGAIFSKKKGDRRISPLSAPVPVRELIGTRSGARFFTALRFIQNDIYDSRKSFTAEGHERLLKSFVDNQTLKWRLAGCLCCFALASSVITLTTASHNLTTVTMMAKLKTRSFAVDFQQLKQWHDKCVWFSSLLEGLSDKRIAPR